MVRLRSASSSTPSPSRATGRASLSNSNPRRLSTHLQPRYRRHDRLYDIELGVDRDLRDLAREHPQGAFGILSEDAHLS